MAGSHKLDGVNPASSLHVPSASVRLDQTATLDKSPETVRAVSNARAQALERMGILTIRELLLHIPSRYLDYTQLETIASSNLGQEATIVGVVDRIKEKRTPKVLITEVYVLDTTGVMRLTFFRQPWVATQLHKGDIISVSGQVKFSYGYKQMTSPFWEKLGDIREEDTDEGANLHFEGRVIPVHPLTKGLSAQWMRRIMINALEKVGGLLDFMPSNLVQQHALMTESAAYKNVHFPPSLEVAEAARRRLAYDELVCLQVALKARHALFGESRTGFAHTVDGAHMQALQAALPFSLTPEQKIATDEILASMASDLPMNRLLLGDVGTGKTIVATFALVATADSNTQAAVMVPTSVLAQQYATKVGPLLEKAGVGWALLTGATLQTKRGEIQAGLNQGSIQVVFGTSALLSDTLVIPRLSLVVVDEQHRFGVEQRAKIAAKGTLQDMLTMTATPIPRTLALSTYGDVEVSRITQRPVEGAGTTTRVLTPENLDLAYGEITKQLEAGHQAYVVCARIEESETEVPGEKKRKLMSAEQVFEHLSKVTFKRWRVGLLTGSMKPQEKDSVMQDFYDHKLDMLVSTTVIEVGVDVPNATALLVFDADRFGLATLHQLRGRVGRGTHTGHVFLCSPFSKNSVSRRRLEALERTDNGFELAELDLEIRREGDILGYRQSGEATLKIADPARDEKIIEAAYDDVNKLLDEDPYLELPQHATLLLEVQARYHDMFSGGARS